MKRNVIYALLVGALFVVAYGCGSNEPADNSPITKDSNVKDEKNNMSGDSTGATETTSE